MKDINQQLKGIAIATVFFFGMLYVQAWTGAPAGIPPANNVDAPINVGLVTQLKSGALGVDGLFRAYGSAIFNGPVNISTGAGAGKVLTSDASGNASWVTPSASGITSESDPTVIASVKDGVSWGEVTDKPVIISSITGG